MFVRFYLGMQLTAFVHNLKNIVLPLLVPGARNNFDDFT